MSLAPDERPTARADVVPPQYRSCFGCGEDNPMGLHIHDIRREGDVVVGTLQLKEDLQGFPGLLHGGVSASALDELMGYATKMLTGHWGATAKMELRYRKPLPDSGSVQVQAGLREGSGRHRFLLWSNILTPDGAVAVEAEALFVPLPDEVTARLDK